MCSLQLSSCRVLDESKFAAGFSSIQKKALRRNAAICFSFWDRGLRLCDGEGRERKQHLDGRDLRVLAPSSDGFKMNLNEYMVTLDRPLGIRFALSLDGKVFVHALQKVGNAEKSRVVMVGDTLKAIESSDGRLVEIKYLSDTETLKAGESSDGRLIEIKDVSDTETLKASESSDGKLIKTKDFSDAETFINEKSGSCSLVLERPFSPFPIHQLYLTSDLDILFNRGRVPVTSWNKSVLASNLQASGESTGNSGFVVFSSKFLITRGWKSLNDQTKNGQPQMVQSTPALPCGPLVAIFTDKVCEDAEWAHGSFNLVEYAKAFDRSKGELYDKHSLGIRYSKITAQIHVGSCIQTEEDVEILATNAGVTAVLNFQSTIEAANWGIDSNSINEYCQKFNILMISYPIRYRDSFDMKKKLPFCVGLLLRLLKKNHRVYVTCTTGLDRAPSSVIAYLHWMADCSLHAAYNFVTELHSCRPDRGAIASATWDLIAMVESGRPDGPSTHEVTFVWNGDEGEDVYLVGDFTEYWKEPIKLVHKGGAGFEVDVRLPQGKYYYKYITNGSWSHSTSSPTERDDSGNVNNVIVVGDVASMRPSVQPPEKDANIIKVIERPLTENERFMLAKAARCVAFGVCPIKLAPK